MWSWKLILTILCLGLSNGLWAQTDCEHPMTIKVKGSISEEDVLNTVKPVVPMIQQCYNRLLAKNKTAAGRVTIISDITKSGKVERVQVCVTDKLQNKRLKQCIGRQMKRLTYPKGITPSEVQFPLDLTSE